MWIRIKSGLILCFKHLKERKGAVNWLSVNWLAAHKRNSSGKGTMDRDDWHAVK